MIRPGVSHAKGVAPFAKGAPPGPPLRAGPADRLSGPPVTCAPVARPFGASDTTKACYLAPFGPRRYAPARLIGPI